MSTDRLQTLLTGYKMSTRRLAEICEDFAPQKSEICLHSGNPVNEHRIKMAYIYRVGEEKMRKLLQIRFRSSKRRFLDLNPGVNGKDEQTQDKRVNKNLPKE
jgi:hypothetical protein